MTGLESESDVTKLMLSRDTVLTILSLDLVLSLLFGDMDTLSLDLKLSVLFGDLETLSLETVAASFTDGFFKLLAEMLSMFLRSGLWVTLFRKSPWKEWFRLHGFATG